MAANPFENEYLIAARLLFITQMAKQCFLCMAMFYLACATSAQAIIQLTLFSKG